MTFQSIVPFTFNGETLYTHSSWFSEKQYNGWSSIPQENKNLAFYYSLSTLSLVGIVTPLSLSSSEKTRSSNQSSAATASSSSVSEAPSWAPTSDG